MDPTFFEVTRTGEVLSRLTTDTTLVQSIAGVNLSITLRSTIQLVGALALLVATSPSLAGMILVLIPLIIVPLIVVGRKLRTLSRQSQDRVADTSGLAGETLNAIQTVQAFTLERLHTRSLQQGGRGFLHGRCTTHARARTADRRRHDDDLRRRHLRALAGRASCARERNDRRPAQPVPDLCGLRRDLGRVTE